jgi:hypothetical protein
MMDEEGVISFIDWELAVWGDPLWDIAAHLHRMAYPATQNKFVRQELLAGCRGFTGLNSQYDELRTFLYIERCRSLVLDAVRDLQAIGAGTMDDIAGAAAGYAAKLSQASVTSASPASVKALYVKYGSRNEGLHLGAPACTNKLWMPLSCRSGPMPVSLSVAGRPSMSPSGTNIYISDFLPDSPPVSHHRASPAPR